VLKDLLDLRVFRGPPVVKAPQDQREMMVCRVYRVFKVFKVQQDQLEILVYKDQLAQPDL
jgi:hypothetical protein